MASPPNCIINQLVYQYLYEFLYHYISNVSYNQFDVKSHFLYLKIKIDL